jgi:hypothetical protein
LHPAAVHNLNDHTERVACVTCHIPSLHPDNVTRRDFGHPVYEEDHGIWIYDDVEKETRPGKGIVYRWRTALVAQRCRHGDQPRRPPGGSPDL